MKTFVDRVEAGRLLGERLAALSDFHHIEDDEVIALLDAARR